MATRLPFSLQNSVKIISNSLNATIASMKARGNPLVARGTPLMPSVPISPQNSVERRNPVNPTNDLVNSSESEYSSTIHVLLVDRNRESLNSTAKMLEQCLYQVTKVQYATTAMKIISSGKKQFDVVMADIDAPDMNGFKYFLQDSVRKDMLVILTAAKEEPHLANNAIENGAFLFVQKPENQELIKYLWQFVMRERLRNSYGKRAKIMDGKNKGIRIAEDQGKNCATNDGGGEENVGVGSENEEVSSQNTTRKRKETEGDESDELNPSPQGSDLEPIPNENITKKKVCTEWTKELHEKFMDAVNQLGDGKCYPKEILELMKVPGLTRMQVASHLQKCRHDNWRTPDQRKYRPRKDASASSKKEAKEKEKLRRFGTMPSINNNSSAEIQQNPQTPINSSVPSGNTNTNARDPENGETSRLASNNTEESISTKMHNEDSSRFAVWLKDTPPAVWNGISVPSPSPATITASDMGSNYFYGPNMTALYGTAAAKGSNVILQSPQQKNDDLSFEFEEIDYLLPDFQDLGQEPKINDINLPVSNPIFYPSGEVFPEQFANVGTIGQPRYKPGHFADASRNKP